MSNEEKNTARETSVFVAVVGKPNVGKSTLVNRLTGAKIAIVSPKPQTTRSRVTGVITRGECQFVFIDTPGFHTPQTRLGEHMVRSVHDAEDEVDAALFVTRPKDAFDDREKELLADLKSRGVPVLLIVNKCDTAKSKTKLAQQLETLKKDFAFDAAAAVSAATGEGCEKLFSLMKKYAGEGPHFYDDDDMTSQTVREMCSEVLREKLLENLRDELPHGCAVEIDAFSQRDNGITDVDAVVYCEKESHKGMIIGKGGAMLKKIASAARLDMEELIGGKVNLQCRVKTREGWRDDDRFIKYLGY